MSGIIVDPEKIRAFATAKAFETWLSRHHDKQSELWLRIYKKGSGVATVTNAEAIECALCWGWIDGQRKAYDELSFVQRFTPRTAKSRWSQINRDHVARLTAAGRMTPHGQREIDAAKADGRWDAAYAGSRTMAFPDDLKQAIEAVPKARKLFETLDRRNLYALAYRVHHTKTPAARSKKIATFVDMLARGETIHPRAERAKAKK